MIVLFYDHFDCLMETFASQEMVITQILSQGKNHQSAARAYLSCLSFR